MLIRLNKLARIATILPRSRQFSRSSIFQDDPIIIDIDEKEQRARAYRGSLLIVPTPLGNLSDMSLRQYEALTAGCDVIACEDTRKTGKMLQLMRDRRLRSKFFNEFGVDVDTFMSGNEERGSDTFSNINDLKDSKVAEANFEEIREDFSKEAPDTNDEQLEDTMFYLSEEEFNDQRILNKLAESNAAFDQVMEGKVQEEEEDSLRAAVQQILNNLEVEIEKNKFGDLEKQIKKERTTALEMEMTQEDRDFVSMVDQEYYKRVKTSDEYYRRKKLILLNLEKLQKKVEKSAQNYDDYSKLKFIMLEKARQKRSVLKNFWKLEDF